MCRRRPRRVTAAPFTTSTTRSSFGHQCNHLFLAQLCPQPTRHIVGCLRLPQHAVARRGVRRRLPRGEGDAPRGDGHGQVAARRRAKGGSQGEAAVAVALLVAAVDPPPASEASAERPPVSVEAQPCGSSVQGLECGGGLAPAEDFPEEAVRGLAARREHVAKSRTVARAREGTGERRWRRNHEGHVPPPPSPRAASRGLESEAGGELEQNGAVRRAHPRLECPRAHASTAQRLGELIACK